ncbi:metallophosphoesterase family protein [Methyloceanibacter sp.]|uniref:metallophosphoesterase family protein n=1 Tax=Methyloceanibacter sp. TaxID=1965321 RepID=UPI003D6CECBE
MSLFRRSASPKSTERQTRLFFASDFHGSQRIFRKFLNAAKHYEADVLIMGGDVVGKLAIPVIREGNGGYRAHLMGKTEHLEGQADLQGFEDRLGTLGYYSKIMDEDEYRAIQSDAGAVESLFHELARQRLASWIELAETRLAGSGVKCFMIGGNDDDPEVLELLRDANTESVVFCEGKQVQIDDHHTMISVGFSNRTPWKTPREVDDDDLGKMIEGLAGGVADAQHAIFNLHVPPVDSTLDTCPMLDWNTSPPTQIIKGGQVVMHGAGSKAVRQAIESHQPLLSLHGHIHESGGVVKIGRTTSVNPGSEYGEGVLRGCLMTLAKDEVKNYQLTAG